MNTSGVFLIIVVVLLLLLCGCDRGVDVALMGAVLRQDVPAIQAALQKGAEMNTEVSRRTPLRAALEDEKLESYSYLLQHGADPDQICSDGHVVTSLAAYKKDPVWLKLALEAGADPNIMNQAKGLSRGTPLYFAIIGGYVINVDLLLTAGTDVNLPCDYQGRHPITIACRSLEFETLLLLLSKEADYNAPMMIEGESFLDYMRDTRPELYAYDAKLQKWCQKTWDWFKDRNLDIANAKWNGRTWDIPNFQ